MVQNKITDFNNCDNIYLDKNKKICYFNETGWYFYIIIS